MPRHAPLLLLLLLAASAAAAPTRTRVVEAGGSFTLLRDGEPYLVRGVGGTDGLAEFAAAGGNSIRTWGVDESTRPLLDEAHALGLTVAVGLWLAPERRGFDYDDPARVAAQHAELLEQVRSVMDHPAVLLWGVGNEMEGEGDRPVIFEAVNALAAALKEMDPNHPTMTVVAELGPGSVKAAAIRDHCPDVDIVGINSYGGMPSVGDRYAAVEPPVGKPYLVTEHGPMGHWEVGKTAWGSPIESTSTEKAAFYRRGYEAAVLGQPDLCLGSYAFLWGWKQETTATWYGMRLPDGSRTGAADAMQALWTGTPPENRAPEIAALTLDGPAAAAPGTELSATLQLSDPEGDPLEVEWVVRVASAGDGVGGDFEEASDDIEGAVVASSSDAATLRMPERPGAYRLFVYARDGRGGAATANAPLLSRREPEAMAGDGATLPFAVNPEAGAEPWAPSGHMGNTEAIRLATSREKPLSGETCLAAAYTAAGGWGGLVWQHPADNWGDLPGGHDLRPATRLTFHARGERGGERVKFGMGVLGADKTHADTASAEMTVTLTRDWKRFELDLASADLSSIKTGFLFAVEGQGRPVRFFLDDIRYE